MGVGPSVAPPLPVAAVAASRSAAGWLPARASPGAFRSSARASYAFLSSATAPGPVADNTRASPDNEMCCEKWNHVAEMLLFIEDREEEYKILCLCSRAFVE